MKKTATGTTDFSLYIERRKRLLQIIQDAYPTCTSESVIVLFAGFEHERIRFRQESSFYYLTGIEEPGVVLTMQLDGSSQLWIPNCITNRAQWMDMPVAFDQANAKQFGVDTVSFLGSIP